MRSVISRDGTRIAFDQTGAGPPVIIVGGALSSRSFSALRELAELLATDFTAINYDRRGRGDSGDTLPYSVEREVEDLEALIDAAGGSACVWGWSSGAALALTAAASRLRIRKLALFEPPYMVGDTGHRPPPDHQAQLTALIAAGRRSAAVTFFMRQMIGIPAIFVFLMRLLPFWSQLKATAHTLPYDAAVMGDFSFPAAQAASITVPTLAIAGEKSEPVLRRAVDAVAETIPGAEHLVLKGQGHNVSMKALAPVLREFFIDGARAR